MKSILVIATLACWNGLQAQYAVTTMAGTGCSSNQAACAGFVNATGSAARFNNPGGMVITPDGMTLFIADYNNHAIRKLELATGAVTTVVGDGISGDGQGAGANARLNLPEGVAISPDGLRLYVADNGNNKVKEVIISTFHVTTIAGSGTYGSTNNPNGLLATFKQPNGLAVSPDGNSLYVADQFSHLIRKVDLSNSNHAVTTLSGYAGIPAWQDSTFQYSAFSSPYHLNFSANGHDMYVADFGNNRIRVMDFTTMRVKTLAGQAAQGNVDGIGAAAQFYGPTGVVANPVYDSLMYILDGQNSRLKKINLNTRMVTTIAGQNSSANNSFADNADGLLARLFFPNHLAISPDGKYLYITDRGNHVIRRVEMPCFPGAPGSIGAISGDQTVMEGDTVTFSVSPVTGADYYVWSLPSGAMIIAGDSTNTVMVVWGSTPGQVTVKAVNLCGETATSNLQVDVIAGVDQHGVNPIRIAPNPASDEVVIYGVPDEPAVLQLLDVTGSLVNGVPSKSTSEIRLDVSGLPSGMYFVRSGNVQVPFVISR